MICPHCATQFEGNFCSSCGKPVENQSGDAIAQPEAAKSGNPTVWVVLCIVFSLIALLFVPILFGGLAIFFASMAKKKGSQQGGLFLGLSIGATVIGIVLGAIVGAMSAL